jgi:sugar phosphate isomerase/epimerase
MRLSFMTFACPEWTYAQVLQAAVDYGYQGLEPRTDAGHQHGLEVTLDTAGRRDARRQAEDGGISLCCLATSLKFAVPAEQRPALLDEVKARVELARDLGIPGLRVFGGKPDGEFSTDDAVRWCGENLRAGGDIAEQAGVELWLESHDFFSTGVLVEQALTIADHPAVHANYDMYHPLRLREDLDTTFEALQGHIRHTHWHDGVAHEDKIEITRMGEGELPLAAIVRRLDAIGYEGFYSGEWFNQQMGATPEESLRHYHDAMLALTPE